MITEGVLATITTYPPTLKPRSLIDWLATDNSAGHHP